jgi:type IX secretion system PorP/SprF family membrane protein
MRFKQLFIIFIFFIGLTKFSYSQDVKFSQYFSSPLTVNPALCGVFNGKYRIMGNYRNQWQEIMYPYSTGTVSAEMQLEGQKFENDILAIGLHAITDKSNNGGLRNSSFAGTISFHKALDQQNYSRLGVGLQAAYTSKVVDFSKMTFETQFTPTGFDGSLPTNELTNGFTLNYLDYSAGLMYSYLSGDVNFYGGAAISHLSRPRETYGSLSARIPMRYTFHAGVSLVINNLNTIYGSLMHLRTSQSNQTTVGLVYGFNLNGLEDNEANEFLVGSWLRLNDAVVPYVGLKLGNIHGGLSYDFTTSNVTVANKGMGGFELSMQVILDKNSNKETIRKMKCKFIMY